MFNQEKILSLAQEVIATEAQAVLALAKRLNEKFILACECLLNCQGRIVVLGIGKSSHIARKIAATLASTGSPAFFVHAGEAGHGDIGVVMAKDVVLAISNSGNTPEIMALLPVLKKLSTPFITLTGKPASPLAKAATINLDVSVEKEACPMGLAPTSSTTTALVMGDALAIALLKARGFTAKDFAFSHPAGILGKRLLLKVADLMHQGEAMPKVQANTTLAAALLEMTQKRLGMTTIVDAHNKLLGIFTDGDLRRAMEKSYDVHTTPISEVMIKNCKTISADSLAIDALIFMEENAITALPVTDTEQKILGVVHIHDILKAGLV